MRHAAHFCMPMIGKGLGCAYNRAVDFQVVREALRRARDRAPVERKGAQRFGMTLDEAAARSGLNRATIHSIENIKREPSLKPELETIERLTIAYGLTVSSFFAQIEGLPAPLSLGENASINPQSQGQAHEGVQALVPEDQVTATVIKTLARLLAQANARADAAGDRQAPGPRPDTNKRPNAHRTRTRRPPLRKRRPR